MIQILLNGVIAGLLIALLAQAFFVVYLSTRVFYVALAGIYVVAPFVAWRLLQAGLGTAAAFLGSLAACVALAVAFELVVHRRLQRAAAPETVQFVASLGLFLLISQTVALVWGTQSKVLRTGLEDYVQFGTVVVTSSQLLAASISAGALLAFAIWLHWTGSGLALRAMAANPREAMLRGCNVDRLRLYAFAWSGGLGALSALLTGLDLGFSSEGGLPALLLAVVASILGARDRFSGPIVGGLVLGLIRAEAVWLLSARWQEALTFLTLVIVLFVRPHGLLGESARLEARA